MTKIVGQVGQIITVTFVCLFILNYFLPYTVKGVERFSEEAEEAESTAATTDSEEPGELEKKLVAQFEAKLKAQEAAMTAKMAENAAATNAAVGIAIEPIKKIVKTHETELGHDLLSRSQQELVEKEVRAVFDPHKATTDGLEKKYGTLSGELESNFKELSGKHKIAAADREEIKRIIKEEVPKYTYQYIVAENKLQHETILAHVDKMVKNSHSANSSNLTNLKEAFTTYVREQNENLEKRVVQSTREYLEKTLKTSGKLSQSMVDWHAATTKH